MPLLLLRYYVIYFFLPAWKYAHTLLLEDGIRQAGGKPQLNVEALRQISVNLAPSPADVLTRGQFSQATS